MGIVQVVIDRSTTLVVEGTYTFERSLGGTLVAPSGSVLPSSPQPGEWFWLTSNNTLYRRNDGNTEWLPVEGNPDPVETPFSFAADCQSSDQVGKCVYINGNSVGGVPQVMTVDPSDYTTMPSVGVILSKSSATSCLVAYFGTYVTTGLTPNARYFVGSGGVLSATVPIVRPFITQVMGQALDTTRLLLTPSKNILRLNS